MGLDPSNAGIGSEIVAGVIGAFSTIAAALGGLKVKRQFFAPSLEDEGHCLKAREWESMHGRMGAAEARISSLEGALTMRQETLNRIEHTLTAMEKNIGRIDSRLSNIEGYNAGVAARKERE